MLNHRELDAKYPSFPSFKDWKDLHINIGVWNKYSERIKKLKESTDKNILDKAKNIMSSATAIDTGAIEGLYKVKRGFTITVATDFALHDSTNLNKLRDAVDGTNEEKEMAFSFIKNQVEAYQIVMEQAVNGDPITPVFMRQLHKEICKSQKSFKAYDSTGRRFNKKLPIGEYKKWPNHVMKKDHTFHSYCPVEDVPMEIEILFREINSKEFQNAHPVLKASYAHYAFILIHPFSDGNGRVARILASFFIYQSEFIPLMILEDKRDEYLSSLEEADKKNFQAFVDFVFERCIDAMSFLEEGILSALYPQITEVFNNIENMKVTTGGYLQDEIERAGSKLIELICDEIKSVQEKIKIEEYSLSMYSVFGCPELSNDDLRKPLNKEQQHIQLQWTYKDYVIKIYLYLYIPKDYKKGDEIPIFQTAIVSGNNPESDLVDVMINPQKYQYQHIIESGNMQEAFKARFEEIVPEPSEMLKVKIKMFVERTIIFLLQALNKKKIVNFRKNESI